MDVFAYGEDALTLWAIKTRLGYILTQPNIGDKTKPENCQVFFRPSFGRSGGTNSSQFGEFDFIILADEKLYLGESKWDRSSVSIRNNGLMLRIEQTVRHEIFESYVQAWCRNNYIDWSTFVSAMQGKIGSAGKRIAPAKSQLAKNLEDILNKIKLHYAGNMPAVTNVLLYFTTTAANKKRIIPAKAFGKGNNGNIINFIVVKMDYSKSLTFGNFITI